MEEPELPDYPLSSDYPNFKKNFGPRGVLDCKVNPDGTQSIHDTGPLSKKRMETIDDEVIAKTDDFLERQVKANNPFFVWFNTSHMHFRTHAKPQIRGRPDAGSRNITT